MRLALKGFFQVLYLGSSLNYSFLVSEMIYCDEIKGKIFSIKVNLSRKINFCVW